MLAAVFFAATLLAAAPAGTFQPVSAQTTPQNPGVFVRDASAPAVPAPPDGATAGDVVPHSAGVRPPVSTDVDAAQLVNADATSLNMTLGAFRGATGVVQPQSMPDGAVRFRANFTALVPLGRYSLFVRQVAARGNVVFTPLDVLGETNNFSAGPDGTGAIEVVEPDRLLPGAQIVLIYHSDGQDHRSSLGNFGVNAHAQLITRVP